MTLAIATYASMRPFDLSLADAQHLQVLDRNGVPLSATYRNKLNHSDRVTLHQVPPLLRDAFVTAEDRHFYEHHGVDWKARAQALRENIRARRAVRGASTITEQVVRILHPRPRTLWSRWVEGFEAMALERRAGKGQILELYLNQVPYAANRRGVAQAARYYFNRDLQTLNPREMLALAVLPRAPGALDLYRNPPLIEPAMNRLADALQQRGVLSAPQRMQMQEERFALQKPALTLNAEHFVTYAATSGSPGGGEGKLTTTLDAALQAKVQALLNERVEALKRKQLHNGAVLVADHATGEILAWAVAGGEDTPSAQIDAVTSPRQPGSALKPFLYALALDSGWSPATILNDEPMAETVGSGLHSFNNYSHSFYGKVSLREALGNSLNIPALHTIRFVGPERYLALLHRLGFDSLTKPAGFYNEGLALGNGEVTLLELVQAYSALAQKGIFTPLTVVTQSQATREQRRVYSEEAASLTGNILSDPWARRLEFGGGSVLNLPVQTAVKTGTSTDYRDAWAVGYDSRYTVGIWMGNLDQTPTDGVTGATGPSLLLRSIFAGLNQQGKTRPLFLSPKLIRQEVCLQPAGFPGEHCYQRSEYFIARETVPPAEAPEVPVTTQIVRPSEGLMLAYDPRLPADRQAFEFVLHKPDGGGQVEWRLNGELLATTDSDRYLWPVKRGQHVLVAEVVRDGVKIASTQAVHFVVK